MYSDSKKRLQKLIEFSVLFLLFMSLTHRIFNEDMVDYVVTQLARFDNTLFTGDFVAYADANSITPKFFNDIPIILLMRLGFTWMNANMFIYLLCGVVMLVAIVQIVHLFADKYQLCIEIVILLALFYLSTGTDLGGNNIWRNSLYNQTIAITISFWGIYFALRATLILPMNHKKWFIAFMVFGVAALFNVQIGFYLSVIGIALLLSQSIMLITDSHKSIDIRQSSQASSARYNQLKTIKKTILKNFLCVLPLVAIVVIFYAVVSLRTSSVLSNKEFIDIYAKLRNPHHLVPSTWNWDLIIPFFVYALMLPILLIICTIVKKTSKPRDLKILLLSTAILSSIAVVVLLANYIFVEIYPLAIVAKMYPDRYFIAFRLWLIIILAYCMYILLQNKRYAPAIFCFSSIMLVPSKYTYLWVLITVILTAIQKYSEFRELSFQKRTDIIYNILFCVGTFFIFMYRGMTSSVIRQLIFLAIFSLSVFYEYDNIKPKLKLVSVTMIILLMCGVTIPKYVTFSDDGIRRKSISEAFGGNDNISDFAAEFKNLTSKDAIFLSDPGKYAALRLYSERAQVVSWKVVPTDDISILKWLSRLQDIGFVKQTDADYVINKNAFYEMSADDLIVIAQKYGADYIVTRADDTTRFLETGKVSVLVEDEDNCVLLIQITN